MLRPLEVEEDKFVGVPQIPCAEFVGSVLNKFKKSSECSGHFRRIKGENCGAPHDRRASQESQYDSVGEFSRVTFFNG